MNYFETITAGRRDYAPRIVVHGVDGIGKSTFAAAAPAPVFLPTENSINHIDRPRFPIPQTWADAEGMVRSLMTNKHGFRTLVIDTLDSMERLVVEHVCKKYGAPTIERADGGFGHGYDRVVDEWIKMERILDELIRKTGMILVMISHSVTSKYNDAEYGQFDVNDLALCNKSSVAVRSWADIVLYAKREVRVTTDNAAAKHQLVFSLGADGGARVLVSATGPNCAAKDRFGLPYKMPLDWGAFSRELSRFFGFDINKDNKFIKEA